MHLENQTYFNDIMLDGETDLVYFLAAVIIVMGVSKCVKNMYTKCCHPFYKWYTLKNIETLKGNLIATSSTICSICLDDYSDPEIKLNRLPCNHVFHKDCIQEWLKDNDTCPECRMKI